MRTFSLKSALPYLTLFGVAVLVFWQVSFFKNTFKWDMITQYFPIRFYIVDCIRSGFLPWWLPYQSLGYPVYGDPQSGVWYPLIWVISIFHRYDIYAAHFEFILTLFLAGAGFYKLAKGFNISGSSSPIAAVCYMCCGFFVGHGQHLTFLISGAFLPFVIHYYLRFINRPHYKDALKTSFFLLLLFTGGYPAFFITVFYILLVTFITKIILHFKQWSMQEKKKVFLLHGLLIIAFLLMSAPALVSWMQALPYTTRSGGLPLHEALVYAFTPQSFISFIAPFSLLRNIEFYDTDPSMSNAYLGIIPVLFLVYFLFRKKTLLHYLLAGASVFFLLVSVGKATPVREWLYHYVPMMNQFRYPSLFTIFFILFFLLLAAMAMDDFFEAAKKQKRKLRIILMAAVLFFLALIVVSHFRNYSGVNFFNAFKDWSYYLEHSTVYDHIIFHSVIQICLLLLVMLTVLKIEREKMRQRVLFLLVSIDMFMATQLNMPLTVTASDIAPARVTEIIHMFPEKFPVPDDKPLVKHTEYPTDFSGIYLNQNLFYRQVTIAGYNPFLLSRFGDLLNSRLPDVVIQSPFCYLPEQILPYSVLENDTGLTLQPQTIYMSQNDFRTLKNYQSAIETDENCRVLEMKPNKIILEANTNKPRLLVILQNNFKGWKASVNNNETLLFYSNYCLMTVPLEKGKNLIELHFQPPHIAWLAVTSALVILIIAGIILKEKIYNN